MTASRPDLRVLAVGSDGIAALACCPDGVGMVAADGRVLVLCEAPADSAAALPFGCERDWCSPGFVVDVTLELVHAGGIKHAGGRGVAVLAQRERVAVSKANRLAQSVADIGKALADIRKDVASVCGDPPREVSDSEARHMCHLMALGCAAMTAITESSAPDLSGVEPSNAARDVLAAHGWRERWPGEATDLGTLWVHADTESSSIVGRGRFKVSGPASLSPSEGRALATLAEETQP